MEQKLQIENDIYQLLKELIQTPSFSKEEQATFLILQNFLKTRGIKTFSKGNNIWAFNKNYQSEKPTLLLNSHHDTVKPNKSYTKNPFEPVEENGKLYGLGSNDAGGPLVCLLGCFLFFYDKEMPINIVFAASAEEEISGINGIESIVNEMGKIDFAIVGEPTLLDVAVAERGLLVADVKVIGKAGHAARNEGVNAIYKAMDEIQKLKNLKFEKTSKWLGDSGLNVTIINAGTAHNQVPDICQYTIDIRLNEHYSSETVIEILSQAIDSEITFRSERLKPSYIELDHPLVKAAQELGHKLYGSPTTSDQALMPWQSIKMGPGDSARSHSADEFIFIHEIKEGLNSYISLINQLFQKI